MHDTHPWFRVQDVLQDPFVPSPVKNHKTLPHISHNLNSLKGVMLGIILRSIIGGIKVDTRSLDHTPYELHLISSYIIIGTTLNYKRNPYVHTKPSIDNT